MTLQNLHLDSADARYDGRRRWLATRNYWFCQAVGWGGVGLLMIGPLPFRMEVTGAEYLAVTTFVLLGIATTHLLRLGLIRLLHTPGSWLRFAVSALPMLSFGVFTHALVQVGIARSILPHDAVFLTARPAHDPLLFSLLDTVALSAALFVTWTGAYVGTRVYRRYQEVRIEGLQLSARVQEAAWQALRAQLNPHLLFNSLNSIRALIPRDLAAPRDAITHLSELLRTTLALKDEQLVPLRRELDTVESFLALERLRFEQRMRVTQYIDPATLGWLVPPFVVQILVENAVKFGVAPHEAGGTIDLRIEIVDDTLEIAVTNAGQLGATKPAHSTGLGLQNLRSRLALLFGTTAEVTVQNHGSDRVLARARVPRQPRLPGSTTSSLSPETTS